MAAGDLYISKTPNLFRRAASDGTWERFNAFLPVATTGLCVGSDGFVRIAAGTGSSQHWRVLNSQGWSSTSIGRTDQQINAIAIDEDDLLYFGSGASASSRIFTSAANNPILSPVVPTDPLLNLQAGITGMSVKLSDGTLAICSTRNVWELAKGGTAWVESVIPANIVGSFSRGFTSITYDNFGGLWVYDISNSRFWHRNPTDNTWASSSQIPTTIDGVTVTRNMIRGSAFDQRATAASGIRLLKIGGADIDALKIGDADVSALYLGDTQVWERG